MSQNLVLCVCNLVFSQTSCSFTGQVCVEGVPPRGALSSLGKRDGSTAGQACRWSGCEPAILLAGPAPELPRLLLCCPAPRRQLRIQAVLPVHRHRVAATRAGTPVSPTFSRSLVRAKMRPHRSLCGQVATACLLKMSVLCHQALPKGIKKKVGNNDLYS